jgi:DNA-binding XRE family transcriptional regulator
MSSWRGRKAKRREELKVHPSQLCQIGCVSSVPEAHGHGTTGQHQAELQQQLREMDREQMVFGQRLLEVRRALGWTQHMAAVELGINVRTVIRHENGQHCTPRVRLPLLLKLRDLERVCAEEILVYLAHEEREHSWLPSVQHRLDG